MEDNKKQRETQEEIIRFIDRTYRDLYASEEVLHHSTGDKAKKLRNIKEYLEVMSELHEKAQLTERRKEILKRMYHERYIIKREDIPDSYYKLQEQILLERGYGHITVDDNDKQQLQQEVIDNQEKSLDIWLDYFLSDDANVYPFWAKYWAFQGMLKLGTFSKEKGMYNRRTKETVAPFADLNREALALSIDMITKNLNKESIDDEQLETLVKGGSFQKIYTYILNTVLKDNSNILKRNEGIWVKYEQGTDHMPLVKSLHGYNTGWCTAGEATAKYQLENGDFYVFYTLDDKNEYKVPRIAIRMEGNRIGEIRGVAKNQNLEPEMEKIVEEKVKDFPGKDAYYKKVNDMNRLTEIYNKQQEGNDLTREDLIFLYEIESKIEGFGYRSDPRIDEIIEARDLQRDLSQIFNCREEYIASDKNKINKKTVVFYGTDLDLSEPEKSIIPVPKVVFGNIIYDGKNNPNQVQLPDIIRGSLYLKNVENIDNMVFPKKVTGGLLLKYVISAKNTIFPDIVTDELELSQLKNGDDLVLPRYVGNDLLLNNLKSARNLIMPEIVNGTINMEDLEDATDIVFPKTVGRDLKLNGLRSASNIFLPEVVERLLDLRSLESANDVVLPKRVGWSLNLNSLKNVDGITFPETVGGELFLNALEEVDELMLPNIVGGDIDMMTLKVANNIIFPRKTKTLGLCKLKYANTLILPDQVDGCINLFSLTDVNTIRFPKTVGKLFLNSLTKVNGLILPEVVEDLDLVSLRDANGLVFPRVIKGVLTLGNIESIEGATLPESVGSIVVARSNCTETFNNFDELREALKEKQH